MHLQRTITRYLQEINVVTVAEDLEVSHLHLEEQRERIVLEAVLRGRYHRDDSL